MNNTSIVYNIHIVKFILFELKGDNSNDFMSNSFNIDVVKNVCRTSSYILILIDNNKIKYCEIKN